MHFRLLALSLLILLSGCNRLSQSRPTSSTQPKNRTPGPRELAQDEAVRTPISGAAWCPKETAPLELKSSTASLLPEVKNHYLGFGNIEGPVWIDGALFYSNIKGGKTPPDSAIFRMVPGAPPTLFLEHSGSNGLATDDEGQLYAATHSDGSIVVRDPKRPEDRKTLASGYRGARFNSPNDLVLARDGTLYFTDPVWQAPQPPPQEITSVYRVQNGDVEVLAAFSEVKNPNGITLSLDETWLFVGGENGLFRSAVGSTAPATRILTQHLGDASGIDGLGRDCAGNLYVTVHSERTVVVLDANAHELGAVSIPSAGGITNVAFGGPRRTTLFVTSLGEPPQIHTIELNVPGYPY